jgi:hypothetical protein
LAPRAGDGGVKLEKYDDEKGEKNKKFCRWPALLYVCGDSYEDGGDVSALEAVKAAWLPVLRYLQYSLMYKPAGDI